MHDHRTYNRLIPTCVFTLLGVQCVFDVDKAKGELVLTEIFPEVTVDEIRAKTEASFRVAEPLKVIKI